MSVGLNQISYAIVNKNMPTKKVTKKSLEKLHDEKFGTNPFAKKWDKELNKFLPDDTLENASQVKSWSKHERAGIYDQIARSIVMFLLGVIIGVVVINL